MSGAAQAGRLDEHRRALVDVLEQQGEMKMAGLYEAYSGEVDRARSKRSVRDYLSDLQDRGFIRVKGEKRGRTYDVRQTEGSVTEDLAAIDTILEALEDPDWGEVPLATNAEMATLSARFQEIRKALVS